MQTIKIEDEHHNIIRSYCAIKDIKIKDFVSEMITKNPQLREFKDSLEVMKFQG